MSHDILFKIPNISSSPTKIENIWSGLSALKETCGALDRLGQRSRGQARGKKAYSQNGRQWSNCFFFYIGIYLFFCQRKEEIKYIPGSGNLFGMKDITNSVNYSASSLWLTWGLFFPIAYQTQCQTTHLLRRNTNPSTPRPTLPRKLKWRSSPHSVRLSPFSQPWNLRSNVG